MTDLFSQHRSFCQKCGTSYIQLGILFLTDLFSLQNHSVSKMGYPLYLTWDFIFDWSFFSQRSLCVKKWTNFREMCKNGIVEFYSEMNNDGKKFEWNLVIFSFWENFRILHLLIFLKKKKQKLKFHFLHHKYEFLCFLQIRILLYCGVKRKMRFLDFFNTLVILNFVPLNIFCKKKQKIEFPFFTP